MPEPTRSWVTGLAPGGTGPSGEDPGEYHFVEPASLGRRRIGQHPSALLARVETELRTLERDIRTRGYRLEHLDRIADVRATLRETGIAPLALHAQHRLESTAATDDTDQAESIVRELSALIHRFIR